jgi:protein O-mannosyl-transferase
LETPSTTRPDRRATLAALAAVAVTLAVHAPSLAFDFVNWDDDFHVVSNPAVQDPGSVGWREHLLTPYLGYPVPLTVASYVVERAVHGPGPGGFHAVNVALHVLNVLLVLAVARRAGAGPWAALFGALLLAVHPAVAEPVSWVSGRKDLLAATFVLLAAWRFAGLSPGDRRWGPRVAVGLLLLAATLCKPVAALVPVLALVLDVRGRPAAWLAVLVADGALVAAAFVLERQVGALEGGAGDGPVTRVLAGAGWHASLLLWPLDLLPKYLDPPGGPGALRLATGAAALAAGAGGLAWAAWRRSPAFSGLALAALAYLPVCGAAPLTRQYADSYLYLPLAGLGLAVAAGISAVPPRLRAPVPRRGLAAALAAALAAGVVLLAGLCAGQGALWQDGVTLWSGAWTRFPDSPQVCRNLGNAHLFGRRDQPGKAAAVYRHCIDVLGQRPFFLKNLAIATARTGDAAAALPLLDEALGQRPGDPALLEWRQRMAARGP